MEYAERVRGVRGINTAFRSVELRLEETIRWFLNLQKTCRVLYAMSHSFRKMSCVALTMLAFGMAPRAKADFVTFTTDYATSSAPRTVPFTLSVNLPTFDTGLGTLTGVQLTLTTNASVQEFVINLGTAATYSNAIGSSTVTVTDPNNAVTTAVAQTTGYTGTLGPGVLSGASSTNPMFVATPTLIAASSTVAIPTVDFSTYEGAGVGSVTFQVAATNGGSGSSTGSSTAFGASSSSYGTLAVTYTYSPVPVPEPSSVALLGLGVGAIVTVGRARRRTV